MNAYKLNGMAGEQFREAICKHLKIHHTEIYKTVKDISRRDGIIELHDGRKFKAVLKEIIDNEC